LRALIDPQRRDLSNGRDRRPRYSAGRWSLLNQARTLEAMCQVLLRRYGVVFREGLTRESNLPNWREILLTLRRLEDRGEVHGGRFVAGFLGEQFALPPQWNPCDPHARSRQQAKQSLSRQPIH
jgi:ATP-dependent Lhr-like helicase